MTQGGHALHFYYDAQSKPSIVIFDGTPYAYLYNLQGDVIALVDGTGAKVVEYAYDAWGRPTGKTGSMASTLGTLQPFRYRGYVFDEETELYYLRSRYYRPGWCRFLNADVLIERNLYNYCESNPVNKFDPSGAVTMDMYLFALTNAVKDEHYNFTDTAIGRDINHKLMNSNMMRRVFINSLGDYSGVGEKTVQYSIKTSDYGGFLDMNEHDIDLYMSIRRADITYTITSDVSDNQIAFLFQQNGYPCFKVNYTISDKYDFIQLMDNRGKTRLSR